MTSPVPYKGEDGEWYAEDKVHRYRWDGETWQRAGNASAKRSRKKGALIAVAAVVGVIALCGVMSLLGDDSSGDDDKKESSETDDSSQQKDDSQEKPAAAKIGEPVRDGKFEFVVNSVNCGETKIGGEHVNVTAQGQFCRVNLKVSNIGDEPQTFFDANQKAYNAGGAEYSTDSTATIYANENNQVWISEINPGNSVTGDIVFDIPQGQSISSLKLHDSAYSGGVAVTTT